MQRGDMACHEGAGRMARIKAIAGSPRGAVLVMLAIAGLAYLAIKQQAVLLALLPFSVLLLCPLMHVFMHRGHSAHDGNDAST
jgi:hypothetical protein